MTQLHIPSPRSLDIIDWQTKCYAWYKNFPTPRDSMLIYHGEPVVWYQWFCSHHDILVPTEYCERCDMEYFKRRNPEKENTAWQVDEMAVFPCNFPGNGYLGHTECQDDDHHFGYDLHIVPADYIRDLELTLAPDGLK